MGRTVRFTALTTLVITGLTTIASGAAPAQAVSALTAPASAAPGTQLWARAFAGLGEFNQPAAMAASPTGSDVFVTGFTQAPGGHDRYATVGYNATSGAKLWRSIFHEGPKRENSLGQDVAVSPGGSTVFVTGSTPLGIGTVAYNAATGAELWAENFTGVAGTGVAVSPDGSTLFVTGWGSQGTGDDYVTLAYSTASGALLWTAQYGGTQLELGTRVPAVAVSPDGSTVFVEGTSGFAFATIAYNASTGTQLWAKLFSGQGSAESSSLAVSPDSSTVFVTGASNSSGSPSSYATVAYNATTGAQRWVTYDAGLSPTQVGRTAANSIAVNRDGTAVFVTGENTAVHGTGGYSTIGYNAATGAKLWQQRYFATGRGGEAAEAWFAGVSPDGSEVFVTGVTHSGHYATFSYNATSGAVLWSQVFRHRSCAYYALAAVNPATPEVMITSSCHTRTSPQDYFTVAYSG